MPQRGSAEAPPSPTRSYNHNTSAIDQHLEEIRSPHFTAEETRPLKTVPAGVLQLICNTFISSIQSPGTVKSKQQNKAER